MKIKFSKYINNVDAHSNVSDVLDGDDIQQVDKLQKEFAEYIGVKFALATSHGTSALHLAMLALDLKRGDKVICSVNAYPNIPEVVRHFDAEPVFIDIEENSYNIDLDKLEVYLQNNQVKKLKAIIVTHIAGCSVDLDRLYEMAKEHKIKVVEDASEAFGATYKGKKIGSTGGDITCFDFSTHLKQNICNGGMFVTNDKNMIQRAKLLSNHAIVQNDGVLDYVYDVVDIGNDYSMSELNAGYIRSLLINQDEKIRKQKEIAKRYNEELERVEHITIPKTINDDQPYFLYVIKVDKNRDSFATELKKVGIDTGLHFIPLYLLSYYKTKYSFRTNDFPVALRNYQQILSLPIYSCMEEKEIKYVISQIKKIALTRV